MPWLARYDPVINWEKRTLVRFGRNATESDGPVSVVHVRKVHPITPLMQHRVLQPPVPTHKSERVRRSLSLSQSEIRFEVRSYFNVRINSGS
ncbi:hypothetical protein Pcac1_g2209 [Phytophthora cactorum]|nr:hypothetical protein Pcac1_g2209 [Phytophthora cactorum]KAG2884248.1 hypothetical protein PC117_g25847 [Phytophthora cactorum]